LITSKGTLMSAIAKTPKPPYYAVIFTSTLASTLASTGIDEHLGYGETANRMVELAAQQPGFLGIESARDASELSLGITVSYWSDLESIQQWKANAEHLEAQRHGHELWYQSFKVRISKVERDYGI
jgi:heme-degrading monooxygenase HmoA